VTDDHDDDKKTLVVQAADIAGGGDGGGRRSQTVLGPTRQQRGWSQISALHTTPLHCTADMPPDAGTHAELSRNLLPNSDLPAVTRPSIEPPPLRVKWTSKINSHTASQPASARPAPRPKITRSGGAATVRSGGSIGPRPRNLPGGRVKHGILTPRFLWKEIFSGTHPHLPYSQFRRSLKTFLFGQWGHGAV